MNHLKEIPSPPEKPPRRYAQGLKLPAYRFIPGVHPHPIKDPLGHSHQKPHLPAWTLVLNPSSYSTHLGYLYGIDLFNQRYWWECHELFEGIWKATNSTDTKNALQSLIQIAAILLNTWIGRNKEKAVLNLFQSVEEKTKGLPTPYLGISFSNLIKETRAWVNAVNKKELDKSSLNEKIPCIILERMES